MANVLQVCRDYGQDLVWWEAQPPAHQALYIGDLRNRAKAAQALQEDLLSG